MITWYCINCIWMFAFMIVYVPHVCNAPGGHTWPLDLLGFGEMESTKSQPYLRSSWQSLLLREEEAVYCMKWPLIHRPRSSRKAHNQEYWAAQLGHERFQIF